MEVIDENGRVFGAINVIDLLVILLVFAVGTAGVTLVLGSGDGGATETKSETATITVQADGVQPYVADAVPPVGEGDGGTVTAIENRTVEPATVVTTNSAGDVLVRQHPTLKTVTVTVTVDVSRTEGTLVYDQQRLKIGNSVSLDFDTVDLRGNVTAVENES